LEAARRIWERMQIPVFFVPANTYDETLDEVKTAEGALSSLAACRERRNPAALDRRDKETRYG
jgi:hypothetical protein